MVATLAEQLESVIARSLAAYKPPKLGLPAEGPWRAAVREHLRGHCREDLALLDAAALRARAVPIETALFPAPPMDPAHVHATSMAELEGACQLPADPELDLGYGERLPGGDPSPWLARTFAETLTAVTDRLVRGRARRSRVRPAPHPGSDRSRDRGGRSGTDSAGGGFFGPELGRRAEDRDRRRDPSPRRRTGGVPRAGPRRRPELRARLRGRGR